MISVAVTACYPQTVASLNSDLQVLTLLVFAGLSEASLLRRVIELRSLTQVPSAQPHRDGNSRVFQEGLFQQGEHRAPGAATVSVMSRLLLPCGLRSMTRARRAGEDHAALTPGGSRPSATLTQCSPRLVVGNHIARTQIGSPDCSSVGVWSNAFRLWKPTSASLGSAL